MDAINSFLNSVNSIKSPEKPVYKILSPPKEQLNYKKTELLLLNLDNGSDDDGEASQTSTTTKQDDDELCSKSLFLTIFKERRIFRVKTKTVTISSDFSNLPSQDVRKIFESCISHFLSPVEWTTELEQLYIQLLDMDFPNPFLLDFNHFLFTMSFLGGNFAQDVIANSLPLHETASSCPPNFAIIKNLLKLFVHYLLKSDPHQMSFTYRLNWLTSLIVISLDKNLIDDAILQSKLEDAINFLIRTIREEQISDFIKEICRKFCNSSIVEPELIEFICRKIDNDRDLGCILICHLCLEASNILLLDLQDGSQISNKSIRFGNHSKLFYASYIILKEFIDDIFEPLDSNIINILKRPELLAKFNSILTMLSLWITNSKYLALQDADNINQIVQLFGRWNGLMNNFKVCVDAKAKVEFLFNQFLLYSNTMVNE